MSPEQDIVLYYREGCHLCEEMAAFLFRHWPGQAEQMRWVDVDSDPELRERFNLDVPVLAYNGAVLCRHLPDAEQFRQYFGPPAIPV